MQNSSSLEKLNIYSIEYREKLTAKKHHRDGEENKKNERI